jgi:hypothetical protein
MLYDSPETANTPFIPPLPSPENLAPPVIPPVPPNHNPPAWAQQPRTPGQFPYYPVTPYNTTPYIPPMPSMPSAHSTPMMPQNSYFPPPANLPSMYGAPPGNGFSADYTGYPNGNPSPYVPTQPPPGTPWAAPGTTQPPPGTPWSAPGTGYVFQQPLPPGPPAWGPQMGAFTPAGYPMSAGFPTPAGAWGMPLPGGPPGMPPGMPPPNPNMYAGHTPWVHPTQPPAAPPQPPDTARANFRWTSSADRIDPFAEGPHCMRPIFRLRWMFSDSGSFY